MAKRKDDVTEETLDYGDILDLSWEDLPEDKLMPTGSWLLGGRNAAYVPPKDNSNGKVLFFYVPKEAGDGVDPGELDDYLSGEYDMAESQVVFTIWIEFNRDWQKVRQHLAKHGLTDTSMSTREALKKFKGTEVVAHVEPRSYENSRGETITENGASQFRAVE